MPNPQQENQQAEIKKLKQQLFRMQAAVTEGLATQQEIEQAQPIASVQREELE